jgi:hypothetical protein
LIAPVRGLYYSLDMSAGPVGMAGAGDEIGEADGSVNLMQKQLKALISNIRHCPVIEDGRDAYLRGREV